jgi:hypothetical protein
MGVWLMGGRPVLAHEGGPRLNLIPPQIMQGATLEVEGVNLGTDLPVTVVLNKDGQRWVLGEATCDGHGDFTGFFELPAELTSGLYTVSVLDYSVVGQEVTMASQDIWVGPVAWFNRIDPNYLMAAWAGVCGLLLLFFGLRSRRNRRSRSVQPGL